MDPEVANINTGFARFSIEKKYFRGVSNGLHTACNVSMVICTGVYDTPGVLLYSELVITEKTYMVLPTGIESPPPRKAGTIAYMNTWARFCYDQQV